MGARDGDEARYSGKGVRKAVANFVDKIAPKVIGFDPARQAEIDRLMISLDGTSNKSALYANAILGVSKAVARAAAQTARPPFYGCLDGVGATRPPVPMMNIVNGSKHAPNSVDFQELMVMAIGAPTFALFKDKGNATSVGDERRLRAQSRQWLRDNLKPFDVAPQPLAGSNGGVSIVPAFCGFYAPYWKESARGVVAVAPAPAPASPHARISRPRRSCPPPTRHATSSRRLRRIPASSSPASRPMAAWSRASL
jgi:Enolase, N-terminal domain/Enolase, C-terminal TIM barrel domain